MKPAAASSACLKSHGPHDPAQRRGPLRHVTGGHRDEGDPSDPPGVVSTGQVQIRPDHVASTWRPTAVWLLAFRTWTGPRPSMAT